MLNLHITYLGITRPLTYPARQNGQLMAKMILGVWLASASITLPPFCGWAKNIHTAGVCLISQDVGYTIYSTALAFYIPMLVMLVMYYKIFKAARKSGAKHRSINFSHREELPTVAVGSEALKMQGLKGPASGMVEECAVLSRLLTHQRHNISIFKREQKAATTLGVIVGVFSICWLPFFMLTTIRPFICGVQCSCVPIWLERTLLWLGYANSLMNPFIYAFFNRDLRSTYRDLLRCRYRNINRRLSAVGVHEALRA
ncbi:5-hydroxytryptamine receptor 7 isoform X1 [Clupea harengus]|uniref:5-hydroxytryptamine receptor 7 isoform X1 n=1 Tax=Clupea harengus TaxID=7950 RepID=A0A8M1KP50_CLUHA|nr:5-hydroxytryptamine receptor 7 isoform X1 [Clupea harengus]